MSLWTHLICARCWNIAHPERAVAVQEPDAGQPCCFCGDPTDTGIYYRNDPKATKCGAAGPVHEESAE